MKKFLCVAILMLASVSFTQAEQISFTWDANTETDLAGYRLFHREAGMEYNYTVPLAECGPTSVTCQPVGFPDDGKTWCFVLRAFDTSDNESGNSNECCYTTTYVDTDPPANPGGFNCMGE